jgi:hypothetical protein
MNMMSVAFQAWVPAILFPTYDQPYVVKGNFGTAGFVAGAFLFGEFPAISKLMTALHVEHVQHARSARIKSRETIAPPRLNPRIALSASLIAYFDHRDKKAALNSEVQSLTEKDTEEKKPVDIEKV